MVPPQLKKEIKGIVYKENWKAEWRFIDMLIKNYKLSKNTTNGKEK